MKLNHDLLKELKAEGREYLDVREVASLFGVREQTLAQRRYRGKGPAYSSIDGHICYKLTDIVKHLDGVTVHSTSEARARKMGHIPSKSANTRPAKRGVA
jgi:hypothetical protein